MIEPGMFFGLGFLTAGLLSLLVIPLIHARAVRLTTRRVVGSTPLTMAEIQADKDQLRAEFALATRRLELTIEQLRAKSTSLLAEIGRKTSTINAMKVDLTEKTAAAFAFETREQSLVTKLQTTEADLKERSERLRSTEQRLARAEARIVVQTQSLEEAGRTIESQRGELVALRVEIGALRSQVTGLEKTTRQAQGDSSAARARAEGAEGELSEARATITGLSEQVHVLQQNLAVQNAAVDALVRIEAELRAEVDSLGTGKAAAETALTEHRQQLAELSREHAEAETDLAALRSTEAELRDTLAATIQRYQTQVDNLSAELAARMARHDAETKALSGGKSLAEKELDEHKRQLFEVTRERNQAQSELTVLRRTEAEKTQRLASMERHYESTISALTTDKAFMEGQLSRTREERARLQKEIAALKQASDAGWQAERKEHALLREHISDVAAEIARITAALEGAESPIHAILDAADEPAAGRSGGRGAARAVKPGARGQGSLADRIRALQTRTAADAPTISAAS